MPIKGDSAEVKNLKPIDFFTHQVYNINNRNPEIVSQYSWRQSLLATFGMAGIDWDNHEIALTPQIFFREFPLNTVGLTTKLNDRSIRFSVFPYIAEIQVGGIKFMTYYDDEFKRIWLKGRERVG